MGYFTASLGFSMVLQPKMSSLPEVIKPHLWTWTRINRANHPSDGFWIGTNEKGERWLTKLRGSFYAYREIVFSRLAQELGWSIQSSCFVILDKNSAAELGRDVGEIHSLHCYMQEHATELCSKECPIKNIRGPSSIERILSSGIKNIRDLIKCDIAAYLFGANELCGYFFTPDHGFVIIDSEQMFSTESKPIEQSDRLNCGDGINLAIEVCEEIASLNEKMLSQILKIPDGVNIEENWSIKNILDSVVTRY